MAELIERRVAFPPNWPARLGLVALGIYVIYAGSILDISWPRFAQGLDHGAKFLGRMFPPNVSADKLQLLESGMLESLQIAILFVKAVGFGALAGILALVVASLGFIAKLVAEAVEEMSMRQVEAVRATGASFLSVVVMGVFPQVMPRFVGFVAYQLDSNLRNSALVGLVGGGGIGATLFTAFQRFDYDFVLTIVLAIIFFVMIGEVLSGLMRRLFQ